MNLKRCIPLVLGLVLTWSRVNAADTNAVINGWLSAQTNIHTWTADFTQTRSLKALTQPLTTSGQIWFATPDRFRWELGQPAQTIALRRGDEMFVIYPMLKRAERYPLAGNQTGQWREALALLEAGFPRSRNDIDSRFKILSLTETNGSWELAMQPKNEFARRMMKEIHVGISTKDNSLTSTELVFADDSRMRNDFKNIVLNPAIDEAQFNWKPGPDIKVVEPLGK